jgi:hypothetical protein
MRKILMTMAAVSALSIGVPAAAQNGVVNVRARIQNLETRLDAGIRTRAITRREAMPLRSRLVQLTQLERQYAVGGFNGRETADLQQRIQMLRRDIRIAEGAAVENRYDRNRDGIDDRYDRNADGYDDRYDRNRDGDDDRYDRNNDGNDDRYDRNGDNRDDRYDANRDGYDDRYDRNRDRIDDRYDTNRDGVDDRYDSNRDGWDDRDMNRDGRWDVDSRYDVNRDGYDDRDMNRDGRWDDDLGSRYQYEGNRGGVIGQVIDSITGGGMLRVGQRASADLDVLPYAYRDRYRDGDGTYYRTDGRAIYQIDVRTNAVVRVYPMNR